jgi:hypothetical protein
MKLTKHFHGFVPIFFKNKYTSYVPRSKQAFLPFSFKTVPSLLRTVTFYFVQDLLVVHKFIASEKLSWVLIQLKRKPKKLPQTW